MKYFFTILTLLTFSITALADISDHMDSAGFMFNVQYNNDGTADFCSFSMQFETDDTVNQIAINTPAGYTLIIPNEEEYYNPTTQAYTTYELHGNTASWELDCDFSELTGFSNFGDGTYNVVITRNDNSTLSSDFFYGYQDQITSFTLPTKPAAPSSPVNEESYYSTVNLQWSYDTTVDFYHIELESTNTSYDFVSENIYNEEGANLNLTLQKGIWELSLIAVFGDLELTNSDGITYTAVKAARLAPTTFAVNMPWTIYEVWGAQATINDLTEVGTNGQTLLGYSDGSSQTFFGNYPYYIIAARYPVQIDAITGNDGNNFYGQIHAMSVIDQQNIIGPANQQYARLGEYEEWTEYKSFIAISNPYNWTSIMLTTDSNHICPTADLTGDCKVDINDLAIFASQWLAN